MKRLAVLLLAVILLLPLAGCSKKRTFYDTPEQAADAVPCRRVGNEVGRIELENYLLVLHTHDDVTDRIYYILFEIKNGAYRVCQQSVKYWDSEMGYDKVIEDELDIILGFSTREREEPLYEGREFEKHSFEVGERTVSVFIGTRATVTTG